MFQIKKNSDLCLRSEAAEQQSEELDPPSRDHGAEKLRLGSFSGCCRDQMLLVGRGTIDLDQGAQVWRCCWVHHSVGNSWLLFYLFLLFSCCDAVTASFSSVWKLKSDFCYIQLKRMNFLSFFYSFCFLKTFLKVICFFMVPCDYCVSITSLIVFNLTCFINLQEETPPPHRGGVAAGSPH